MISRRSVLLSAAAAPRPFFLGGVVDFVDDASAAVYTPRRIDAMMRLWREMGIRRVYWMHYGDARSEGFWTPYGGRGDAHMTGTIQALENPLGVAVKAARRHGLEIYGFFKPWETGLSMLFPEGSEEARRWGRLPHLGASVSCVMKTVREHPEWRIRRRQDDLPPGLAAWPVDRLRLWKTDTKPTRVGRDQLEIWTSGRNLRYTRKPVRFDFRDTVEAAPRDFSDLEGRTLARRGDPLRVLTLEGFYLTDKFILVTTNCSEGPGDFRLSAPEMLEAFSEGRPVPITTASGGCVGGRSSVWCADQIDFRNWGVEFDTGFGRTVVTLDAPNRDGKLGFVALARGRNEYLPAALCESQPEVRRFWLDEVTRILETGVDGIDFRIENHCTHTDDPFAYGWNDVVVREAGTDAKAIAKHRSRQYTRFLREARQRIRARGKKMQLHLNVEFLRSDPRPSRRLAYPWNIEFDWRGWLAEGLADEATLRTFQYTPEFVLKDEFSLEVIEQCRRRSIPLHYNRYTFAPRVSAAQYVDDLERIRRDGRFASFLVYESANFLLPDGEGLKPHHGVWEAVRAKAKELRL